MKNEPVIHDKHHPIETSARPDNAYYLRHCPIVERGPSYASCLGRLDDIKRGIVNERTAQCVRAVQTGACISAGMREQEQVAGSALFYFPRTNKPYLPSSVAGDFGVLITNHTDPALYKPTPKAAPAKAIPIDTGTFADALTMATSELAAATPEHPASQESVKVVLQDMKQRGVLPSVPPMVAPVPPEPLKTPVTARPPINPGETPLQYARRLAALKTST